MIRHFLRWFLPTTLPRPAFDARGWQLVDFTRSKSFKH